MEAIDSISHFTLATEAGVVLFTTLDLDPEWRGRPRLVGVNGHLFAEGIILASVALRGNEPPMLHFFPIDVIGFQVVDTAEGNSARGDWDGNVRGVVRPLLKWTTEFQSSSPELSSKPLP